VYLDGGGVEQSRKGLRGELPDGIDLASIAAWRKVCTPRAESEWRLK